MLTLTSEEIKKFLEAAAENNKDWKDPYVDNKEMVAFAVGLIYVELVARKNGWNKSKNRVRMSPYGKINSIEWKWDRLSSLMLNCFKEASHEIYYDETQFRHLFSYMFLSIPREGELTQGEKEALTLGLMYVD